VDSIVCYPEGITGFPVALGMLTGWSEMTVSRWPCSKHRMADESSEVPELLQGRIVLKISLTGLCEG
jgi:hypothetical protein